ncbi:MAG: type II toxin-antitoxin system Y4mF family antitoxin [bacterium]
METATEIGSIVRFHRRAAGLTQAELAKMAGVGKTVVFDVEKGKQSVQFDTLLKILDILNIKLEPTSPLMSEFLKTQSTRSNKASR